MTRNRFLLTSLPLVDVRALALALRAVEAVLIVGVVWAAVGLFWVFVRPYGPVGRWTAIAPAPRPSDYGVLTQVDPFFRAGATGPAAVTALPLKLFGVRVDEATGRGSAIIATPDGVQTSYGIGDEIMPGVRLRAVAFDNVTIDRGGTAEQLFIDQSVAASVATPGAALPSAGSASTPVAAVSPSLTSNFGFDPHIENGKLMGFVVQPKGNGDVFRSAGFQPGDVVTSVNGRELHAVDDAAQAIASMGKDSVVTFVVSRGGKPVTLATRSPR